MAGVSVSNLILFIAAMGIAAAVAGTLVASVDDVSTSIDRESLDVAAQIDTDVHVVSDPGSGAVYNGSVVVVLVNGWHVSSSDWTVRILEDETWRPGVVIQVSIERDLVPGEHRVRVSINQNSATLEFYYEG